MRMRADANANVKKGSLETARCYLHFTNDTRQVTGKHPWEETVGGGGWWCRQKQADGISS